MFQQPKGYVLVDRAKREAAEVAAEKTGNSVLAEYDKRGGLIRDSKGNALPAGGFWDFESGKPKKKGGKVRALLSKVVSKVKKAAKKK